MAILTFNPSTTGLVGVNPRIVYVTTNDSLATVTTAGYIDRYGSQLLPTDILALVFVNAGINETGFFTLSISGSVITLLSASDNVLLPVVNNDFVNFNGTNGGLKDSGYSPTNAAKTKVIMANGSFAVGNFAMSVDTAGTLKDSLISPTDATKTKALMASSAFTIGHLPAASDIVGTMTDSGVVANEVLQSTFANPDPSANVVYFRVAIGATALNSGSVTLLNGGFTNAYRIMSMRMDGNGTDFDASGNRLLNISDGTTSYTNITAATLKSLVNARWGDTAFPSPSASGYTQITAAGQPILAAYTGGTTNYAFGLVVIDILAVRVS